MGPYKPLRNWVDEFIPYYIWKFWEFRPWHMCTLTNQILSPLGCSKWVDCFVAEQMVIDKIQSKYTHIARKSTIDRGIEVCNHKEKMGPGIFIQHPMLVSLPCCCCCCCRCCCCCCCCCLKTVIPIPSFFFKSEVAVSDSGSGFFC